MKKDNSEMRALLDEFRSVTLSVMDIETRLENLLLKLDVRKDDMAHILVKFDLAGGALVCAMVTTRGVLGMDVERLDNQGRD